MADVTPTATGLDIELPGGRAYFNAFWLRDNCASSFDPVTRERVFDIATLAEPPRVARAWIEGAELVVDWAGEAHVSRHALDWLDAHARGAGASDPAALPRRLWYADHYGAMARFAFDAVRTAEQSRAAWARALIVDGVAIVEGMPDTDAGLTALATLLGSVRPSVTGDYFDVRVHIDPVNLSFTSAPLDMHTDTPAEEFPPGVQFLHCRRNSVDGGDNLFLDGAAVAEDFRHAHPADFALLAETEIPFYYSHASFDWRAHQRVIELDRQGTVTGVTVSRHMADVIDLPQDLLDAYYPALWRFSRCLGDPRYLMRFRLKAGECIVFDNHRIVHGRDGYTATSGERHLRGCYIDRGELRSTYRILSAMAGGEAVPA